MYSPVIDKDLVPDYTRRLLDEGKFPNLPVIFGDDQNEGSMFAPRRTSTLNQSNAFLRSQFPALTTQQLSKISHLFPKTKHRYGKSGAYWQQLANAYGAIRYSCPKIALLNTFAEHNDPRQTWGYRYAVLEPSYKASGLGTPHTAEAEAIWGPHYANGKSPKSYYTSNAGIVPVVQGYWSSFIRHLDPNKDRADGVPEWKTWNASSSDSDPASFRQLFLRTNVTQMQVVDKKTRSNCDYLIGIGVDIKQ